MTNRPALAARRSRAPRAALGAILAAVVLASCSSKDAGGDAGRASGGGAPSPNPAISAGAGGTPNAAPPCLLEGDWTSCAVEDRLTHAGVVFTRKPEPATVPFLKVAGTVYEIGSPEHEVQVFLYPTAAAREQDTAALDSTSASPRGTRHPWRTPPTLVTSNNLAAVILSLNDRTVERLALALGAGLPQPGKR